MNYAKISPIINGANVHDGKCVGINFERLYNQMYYDYFQRYEYLCYSLYTWEGIPDNIPKEYIEMKMFSDGKLLFFDDETTGYQILPFTEGATKNQYGISESYEAQPINGYTYAPVTSRNSVILKNNFTCTPTAFTVDLYCKRMANLAITGEMNIAIQKFPMIIEGNEKNRATITEFYNKLFTEYQPVFLVNEHLNLNSKTNILNFNQPFIIDQVRAELNNLNAELKTILGIDNLNSEKKERLLVDEVNANNDEITKYRLNGLLTRQNFCEEVKEKFGLDISVQLTFNGTERSEDNELLYGTTQGVSEE